MQLRPLLLGAALALATVSARAQVPGYPSFYPPLTSGNCVQANSPFQATTTSAPCGAGTVSAGTINQLAWYAATGNAISGLATANNGVLVTSAGGVPSISSTLPTGITLPSPIFTGTLSYPSAALSTFGPASNQTGVQQINDISVAAGGLYLDRFSADTSSENLVFHKSRGATVGTNTTVANSDTLGNILIRGADGTNYPNAASISVVADGAVSTGIVPARIVFSVANSSGTNTERARIGSDGTVTLGAARGSESFRVITAGPAVVGANFAATGSLGELAFTKIAASGSAPGAAGGKIEFVCGTNAGSLKIIAYGGTSTTPVTVTDNIGSGATGC